MERKEKKKSVENVLAEISALQSINTTKFYTKLKPVLMQKASEEDLLTTSDLIKRKLSNSRFELYLKIVPLFTPNQMQTKNRENLLNRLYSLVKEDVKSSIDELDDSLTSSLDLLSERKQNVLEWLLPTENGNQATINNEQFVFRATLCYIYVSLKMIKTQTVAFEQLLLSLIEKDKKISFDKFIGKLFPEILLSKNLLPQVEKFAYFHHKDRENMDKLQTEFSVLKEKYNSLIAEKEGTLSEILRLKTLLGHQELLIKESNSEIARLNSELTRAENRLEYEIHKYKEENRTFQIAYTDKLKRRILIEIEGINTTLNRLEGAEKCKLQQRVSNIEDVLGNKEA